MVEQVGKYILEKELGKGAMGSVWLSHHPGLKIPVAVKILNPSLAASDPDYYSRFIKEGTLAASINHQNIVRVYDAGNEGDTYYLVLEYVEGMDAKEMLAQRGRLPVEDVIELAISTAEALKMAHSNNIVHRDIKPDNIMVTTGGDIKLADLGIAKHMNDSSGSTMSGTAMGTPYYIAPEQATDASTVDHRCDIYSLGATLYHLLTATLPFTGSSSISIMVKHTQEKLDDPRKRRADLPANICKVIMKMMEKDPDARYKNCSQLLEALNAIKYGKDEPAKSKKIKHFKAPSKTAVKDEKKIDNVKSASTKKSVKKRKRKRKRKTGILMLALLFAALGITVAIMLKKNTGKVNEKSTGRVNEKNTGKVNEQNPGKANEQRTGFSNKIRTAETGIQVLYTFDSIKGNIVKDSSGVGKPLDLKISDVKKVKRLAGSIKIRENTIITSIFPGEKLIASIQKSEEISIEAWLKPLNNIQKGPARIITLSTDPFNRSFTVGQELNNYDFRFTTSGTNKNGMPSVESKNKINGKLSHIVYTRNKAGKVIVFINGKVSKETSVKGTVLWKNKLKLALANELTGDRPWLGTLKLVAIYSKSLSIQQVKKLYEAGSD